MLRYVMSCHIMFRLSNAFVCDRSVWSFEGTEMRGVRNSCSNRRGWIVLERIRMMNCLQSMTWAVLQGTYNVAGVFHFLC